MAKLLKLLLVVIFLAGCTGEPQEEACESVVTNDAYTIKKAYNGVYIYTDNPQIKDMKVYF